MINKIRSQETGGPVVKISNLAVIPAVRFPAPAAGPPGRTPALALVPFMPVSRLHADTVLLAHIQATRLLSRESAIFGRSSPDTPPQDPQHPRVLQKEAKCLLGHRLQTLAPCVGRGVCVAACGIRCVLVPHVPFAQSSSASAPSTFAAASFFVRDRPGHRKVLSSSPASPWERPGAAISPRL